MNLKNYERLRAHTSAQISDDVQYFGTGEVVIGAGSRIDAGCILTGGDITIGQRTHIPPHCVLYGKGGIVIGDLVNFGVGTVIHTESESFDGQWLMGPLVPEDMRRPMRHEVVIESVATICAKATILPGVRIGEGAVVGAHSLVMQSVAALEKVAGCPAKRIGWVDKRCLTLANAVLEIC